MAALWLGASTAAGDAIHLKNGNVVEGLIRKESATSITVDLGVGSMQLDPTRIERIDRSDAAGRQRIEEDWRTRYFLNRKYVPPDLRGLGDALRSMLQKRDDAIRARQVLQRAADEERALEAEVARNRQALLGISQKLADSPPGADPVTYNALVASNNVLISSINLKQEEIEKHSQSLGGSLGAISSYMESLSECSGRVAKETEARRGMKPDADVEAFLARAALRVRSLEGEFADTATRTEIRHGNAIVTALVNDQAEGRFLVDTGAAVVSLTESFVKRLNISTNQPGSVDMVLADGTKVKAKPLVLRSVRVGDARAENVPAVVMPSSVERDVDGLLGMTFLKNFIIRLDGASGKLILTTFNPKQATP